MPVSSAGRLCPLFTLLRFTKMVYSSSLMEANFFTIAQRRELIKVRVKCFVMPGQQSSDFLKVS